MRQRRRVTLRLLATRVATVIGLGAVTMLAVWSALNYITASAEMLYPQPLPKLPADVCATLKAERAKYGTPIAKADLGKVLNATAYAHRNATLGLGGKTSGTRCPSPAGSISCDLLYRKSDGVGWDSIVDVEGSAVVTCSGEAFIVNNRPWVAPVNPGTPPDPPPAPCTCTPHPVNAEQFALLSARVDSATQQIALMDQRIKALEKAVAALSAATYEVNFSSSREWGHAHTVKGPVMRVP